MAAHATPARSLRLLGFVTHNTAPSDVMEATGAGGDARGGRVRIEVLRRKGIGGGTTKTLGDAGGQRVLVHGDRQKR